MVLKDKIEAVFGSSFNTNGLGAGEGRHCVLLTLRMHVCAHLGVLAGLLQTAVGGYKLQT